ncbi:hypothetical protein Tco_0468522 [Tanacetum coccineum]
MLVGLQQHKDEYAGSLASEGRLVWMAKKHMKYRNVRNTLAKEKAKIEEELKSRLEHMKAKLRDQAHYRLLSVDFRSTCPKVPLRVFSEFYRAFVGVGRVAGFIPVAMEKFDLSFCCFSLDATFPFWTKVLSTFSGSSLKDIGLDLSMTGVDTFFSAFL